MNRPSDVALTAMRNSNRKIFGWLMLTAVLLSGMSVPAFAQTKIVLDDADSGRVFEGIGAISQGGTSLNMVDDANRKSGMAYLLSSCDPNCFDNLSVTP